MTIALRAAVRRYAHLARWPGAHLVFIGLLSACSFAEPGVRRGVRIGQAATEQSSGTCPRVDGVYRHAGNVLGDILNGLRPLERRATAWAVVRVTQPNDSVLGFDFRLADGTRDMVTLRQPGNYSCASGWIELRYDWEYLVRPEPGQADERYRRWEFRVAADDEGALVGRLVERSFRQFDVWCGDGCKGFPIPGTGQRSVVYARLLDSSAPPQPDTPLPGRRRVVSEDERSARLAAEEAALEQGPPPPPLAARVRTVVAGALPPSVQLLAVTVRGDSAKLSLALPAAEALPILLRRLQATPGVRRAVQDPLERSRTADGGWGFSVWVHLEPTSGP